MEQFLYIFLNLVLLLAFCITGKSVERSRHGYFVKTLPVIALFVFVQGSRYLRGNDYRHYIDVYLYDLEDGQVLFTAFNDFLKGFGVGAYSFYYVYALVFICCGVFFLKRYKEYGRFIYPLFLMAFLMYHEYMIRQALGTSFLFLFLCELSKIKINKFKDLYKVSENIPAIVLSILFALMSYSIHSANIIFAISATLLYFFYKRAIPLIVSIPTVILANYVFQYTFDYNLLSIPLSYLAEADDKMAAYAGNADVWFSSSGFNSVFERNPIVLVLEVFGCISLFYFGKKALDKYNKDALSYTLYNLFVIGYISQGLFRQLELLNRMGFAIGRYWFVPLSVFLLHRNQLVKKWYEKVLVCGLIFWLYEYAKFILYRNEPTLFIWDKIG